jgi:hypothetical protein
MSSVHETPRSVRPPAVAGQFYPDEPATLRELVAACLEGADPGPPEAVLPKAWIVPHAGFVYSGPIAASAYVRLGRFRERVKRVVLIGPSHRVGFRGIAVPTVDAFETPLGRVPLDRDAIARALGVEGVQQLDAAHAREHSLEVQLPFLQTVLADFTLVPLVVGQATGADVARVLEALWGGEETVIVVSSDLSHYLPYDVARRLDADTTLAIEQLAPDSIRQDQACGRLPVQGLLLAARSHGLRPATLDVRSSGDTAGDQRAVVGYGAWAFSTAYTESARRDAADRTLVDVARASIERGLREGKPLIVDAARFDPPLRRAGASFVTLKRDGQLRGCVGSLEETRALVVDVAGNAFAAAFRDARFHPVTAEEWAALDLHISLLGPREPLAVASEDELLAALRPGEDGLVLADGARRATFLPAVWEQLAEPREFVAHLKRKAGFAADHWSATLRCWRYAVREIGA